MANKKNMSVINEDDMPILDEVVFKIHKNGYFEFDPLRVEGRLSFSQEESGCGYRKEAFAKKGLGSNWEGRVFLMDKHVFTSMLVVDQFKILTTI
ncbi:hypothetical protein Tco_1091516 [Tanacetum coccineum]|uniref:Uncharacterized protein n=1 Tax=Tanacetum coccineum TaxID=301880 RepID=A0ABQ5I7D8_9ASTR